MPWAAVGTSAVLGWLLAAWCIASCVGAWQTLADREASLADLAAGAAPGIAVDVRTFGPVGGMAHPEDAVQQLVADASRLLEHVESLAASVGVTMLQFLPEVTPAGKDAAFVRLHLRGPPPALEALLVGLGDPAPAVELTTLRLAASPVAGELLCELGLRLHDGASLERLGKAAVAPGYAARAVDAGLIPAGVFGPPGTLRGAAQVAVANVAQLAMAEPQVAQPGRKPDPLLGVRLLGLLRKGQQFAALLDSPATGPVLLRPSESLGLTRFRLEAAAAGRATLANDAGERRVLELEAAMPGSK